MNNKKIAVSLSNLLEVPVKDIQPHDMSSSNDGWSRITFAVLLLSIFAFTVAVGVVFGCIYFPKNKLPKIASQQSLVKAIKLDSKLNDILASKDHVSLLI